MEGRNIASTKTSGKMMFINVMLVGLVIIIISLMLKPITSRDNITSRTISGTDNSLDVEFVTGLYTTSTAISVINGGVAIGVLGSIRLLDAGHPDAPIERSNIEIGCRIQDMISISDYIYVLDKCGAVYGINVRDIDAPEMFNIVAADDIVRTGIAGVDGVLYISERSDHDILSGLRIVDINDMLHPAIVNVLTYDGDDVMGVEIANDVLVVSTNGYTNNNDISAIEAAASDTDSRQSSGRRGEILFYDIDTPLEPNLSSSYISEQWPYSTTAWGNSIAVNAGEDISTTVKLIDISDKRDPIERGEFIIPRHRSDSTDSAIIQDIVAGEESGEVLILESRETSGHDTPNNDMTDHTLLCVNWSIMNAPDELESETIKYEPYQMARNGDYVYITGEQYGTGIYHLVR